MTTWIGTNQAGWDGNEIGFHSIQGCTGLVLQTDNWIAGWHVGGGGGGNDYMYTGQSKIAFLGPAFLAYVQAIHPNPWPGAGLMAGTNKLRIIHNGHDAWETEVEDFAGIFGYHGTTKGLNLRSKVGAVDSCDVVITKVRNDCQIRYKRTSKVQHTPQTPAQQLASPVMTIYKNGPLADRQPIAGPESHSAAVVRTDSNAGQFHRARWWSTSRHTV
ncbi:hypothetical protein Enr13x_47070 [Stieleria neptunia]|uniref:Uncharacterized protein n=1 Tax=Stieleria neptunia TaxID=2527979 RepID=A0A518HVF6_9BACT|nr:hypothetical protein [Stieleria neptunia]QDV44836.1 hypothetical protein Enr13x_47070 [Stieleria neptunia]